jgi:hypothetical protein
LTAWVSQNAAMGLSNRTLALLAKPFEGGGGPSHSSVEQVWMTADAVEYLPEEGNKQQRVMGGFRALQRGQKGSLAGPPLSPDEGKLRQVTADLATLLLASDLVDAEALEAALEQDGLSLDDDQLKGIRPEDEPADRLAEHVRELFGDRDEFDVARNHYEQASRAFDRGDWEAANAQFRSSCDAVFEALAQAQGCPTSKSGGEARKWLQAEGLLEKDEGELVQKFMAFAGRDGSHPGLSDAADCQLRRHMATALIVFGVAKLA